MTLEYHTFTITSMCCWQHHRCAEVSVSLPVHEACSHIIVELTDGCPPKSGCCQVACAGGPGPCRGGRATCTHVVEANFRTGGGPTGPAGDCIRMVKVALLWYPTGTLTDGLVRGCNAQRIVLVTGSRLRVPIHASGWCEIWRLSGASPMCCALCPSFHPRKA